MRKKVLFLIESLSGGGAEKVLTTLIENLDRDRFDITLCPVVDTGVYAERLRGITRYRPLMVPATTRLGKLWFSIKYHLIYNWLPLWLTYRLFVPKGADVEVAFCEGFATRLLAHSSNKHARRLAWVHTDLHNNHYTRPFYRNDAEEAWCYGQYHHIVAVSRTAEDAFHKEFPSVTTPITTIYNPIDVEAIRAAAQEVVDLPPKPNGRMRLVSTGRLVPQKGFDRLIAAVGRLVTEGHDVELWILGRGELQEAMEQQIAQENLNDRVKLWGFQRNPYPYLAASDIFVCSSRAEGFSLVIAEALVLGLPVVSTLCAGPNELLDEGKYGILVDNADNTKATASIYDTIKQLITVPNTLTRYRKAAQQRGATFSLATTISQVEKVIISNPTVFHTNVDDSQ